MSLATGEFSLAGTELKWPIGIGAGYTNHPDIEVVARRLEEACATGVGFVTLGSWKLGEADGGNGYVVSSDGGWDYIGGEGHDEYHDVTRRLGYNAKRLPGPGAHNGIDRLEDLVDITRARGVGTVLSLSPHSNTPLDEMPELLDLANRALRKEVDSVEINLSCPNLEGRPAFYLDGSSVVRFLEMVSGYRSGVMLNSNGQRGLRLKFGPMTGSENDESLRQAVISYRDWIGSVVTSNTIGNQEPKFDSDQPVIRVNGGRAGMSGPGCVSEGAKQLDLWNASRSGRGIGIVSVLGVGSGDEAYQRMLDGADTVQAVSAFYWPDLVGKDSPGAVFDAFAKDFSDMHQSQCLRADSSKLA